MIDDSKKLIPIVRSILQEFVEADDLIFEERGHSVGEFRFMTAGSTTFTIEESIAGFSLYFTEKYFFGFRKRKTGFPIAVVWIGYSLVEWGNYGKIGEPTIGVSPIRIDVRKEKTPHEYIVKFGFFDVVPSSYLPHRGFIIPNNSDSIREFLSDTLVGLYKLGGWLNYKK
jgi:hypothetical protein